MRCNFVKKLTLYFNPFAFASLSKVLKSEKRCVCLLNICVLPQNYCVPRETLSSQGNTKVLTMQKHLNIIFTPISSLLPTVNRWVKGKVFSILYINSFFKKSSHNSALKNRQVKLSLIVNQQLDHIKTM